MKAASLVLALLLAGCAAVEPVSAPIPTVASVKYAKVKPAPAVTAAPLKPTANQQVNRRWQWPTFWRKSSTTN